MNTTFPMIEAANTIEGNVPVSRITEVFTKYWDLMSKPPQSALKQISGGRMNGKTDINPQWRLRVMTETFGPVGLGWRYEIKRVWTEPGPNGEVMAFAEVWVWYQIDGYWSFPIPGIGGNGLVNKESGGLRSNDEGYKMAITDALSVALKSIGVAADIYLGNWDGSKWQDRPAEKKAGNTTGANSGTGAGKTMSGLELAVKQAKGRIANAAKLKGYEDTDLGKLLGDCAAGFKTAKKLEEVQAAEKACMDKIAAAPAKAQAE